MKFPAFPSLHRPVVVSLMLVYVLYSLPGITRPWGNDHNGFLQKEKVGFAINYLTFGLWTTGLGQKMDDGGTLDSAQKRYSYYIRHPMGVSLLTALSFKLFGVTEWASRLVAVLLNLGILSLLYLFFDTYWDRKTALLALFFVVCSHMFFYIRHLLAFELLALFCISAFLYLYAKWQTTGLVRYRSLLFASVSLGTLLSDWQAYFLVPGLVVHNLLWAKRKEKKILLLIPLACLMFTIYLAYVRWLTGSVEGGGTGGLLWQNMLLRMNLSESAQSANITASKWVAFLLKYYSYFYTPVLGVLTLLWAALFLLRLVLGRGVTEQDGLLICCFVSLASYLAVFSHAYMCCEFMNLFFLPVAGLFGARVIVASLDLLRHRSPLWVSRMASVILIGGSAALFLWLGYPKAETTYRIQNQDLPLNTFFAIHRDDIIVGFDEDSSFYQLRPYLQRRTVRRVYTLDQFSDALGEGGRYRYLVLKRGGPANPALRDVVSARYPSRLIGNSTLEEYDIFDIRSGIR